MQSYMGMEEDREETHVDVDYDSDEVPPLEEELDEEMPELGEEEETSDNASASEAANRRLIIPQGGNRRSRNGGYRRSQVYVDDVAIRGTSFQPLGMLGGEGVMQDGFIFSYNPALISHELRTEGLSDSDEEASDTSSDEDAVTTRSQ